MTITEAPPATGERTRPMTSHPRLLQGVFSFEGQGLASPTLLDPAMTYVVPQDHEAQLVYFRGGNASDGLVSAVPSGKTTVGTVWLPPLTAMT